MPLGSRWAERPEMVPVQVLTLERCFRQLLLPSAGRPLVKRTGACATRLLHCSAVRLPHEMTRCTQRRGEQRTTASAASKRAADVRTCGDHGENIEEISAGRKTLVSPLQEVHHRAYNNFA